jgi:hypothetical protein
MKLIKNIFEEPNIEQTYSLNIENGIIKLINENEKEYIPSNENIKEILENYPIINGRITKKMLFIENELGLLELVAKDSKKYRNVLKNNTFTLRNISVGEEVEFINEENEKYIYLGNFYTHMFYKRTKDISTYNLKFFLKNNNIYCFSKTPDIIEIYNKNTKYINLEDNFNMIHDNELNNAKYNIIYKSIVSISDVNISIEDLKNKLNNENIMYTKLFSINKNIGKYEDYIINNLNLSNIINNLNLSK